ncbi:tRNA (guanosine(46)-N7)-methyltransferase TrmB, partial [Cyanobium sp. LEGE 06143]|uniref:tRNA (guanosine(46)-N7)-methyltransferase TrmB n=1 Tax=Cyanobium sp. LEGE 06143 TaxID=945727 RepID=UPI001880D6BF|nr:tRNA (guanosine(46)-N7)-methyltransferase TrmB [Cyanobium sp. LEGE 06143]
MRQHVNPLSSYHQAPRPLPPPAELFEQPSRPIHLDIGCARGRFLLAMAEAEPQRNYLGLEIRLPLVEAAEAEREALQLAQARILYANANVSLGPWLAQLQPGQLERVSIQFPDPWFKHRHHKRRVLQPALLNALAGALLPGRELFIQSDVEAVVLPMVALIEASGCFTRPAADPRPWRPTNPLPVPTERERFVLDRGLPVYRVLYRRNDQPVPPLLERQPGEIATAARHPCS